MRRRVFLIGLFGGLLMSITLMGALGAIVTDGVQMEAAFMRWLAAGGALLLLTGALAGAMSGSGSRWGAVGAGALAGWQATWIAETLVGGMAMGAYGALPLLEHGMKPTASETQYIALLAESVLDISVFTHASIGLSALAGVLLGGLGGLLVGARGRRAEARPRFWLGVTLLNLLLAGFNLVVFSEVYSRLSQALQSAAEEASAPLPFSPALVFEWPLAVNLLWLLFWQAIAWRLLPKVGAARHMNGLKAALLGVLGGVLVLGVTPLLSNIWSDGFSGLIEVLWLVGWLGAAALMLFLVRFVAQRFPRRIKAFLQAQGEARLAGWVVLTVSTLVLLAVLGILRFDYPWLTAGLLVGVLISGAGIRSAWKATAPAEEQPLRSGTVGWTALLGWHTGGLLSALYIIAPLAMVMLVITMIPYILPENAASPADTGTGGLLAAYFNVTLTMIVSVAFLLPLGASALATLFQTLFHRLDSRKQREVDGNNQEEKTAP